MPHDNANDPQGHYLWPDFVKWGEDNCVSFDHEDDWKPWWDCFVSGAAVQFRFSAVGE